MSRRAESRTSASFCILASDKNQTFSQFRDALGAEEMWHRVSARGRAQANSETGIDNNQTQSHKESQSEE